MPHIVNDHRIARCNTQVLKGFMNLLNVAIRADQGWMLFSAGIGQTHEQGAGNFRQRSTDMLSNAFSIGVGDTYEMQDGFLAKCPDIGQH